MQRLVEVRIKKTAVEHSPLLNLPTLQKVDPSLLSKSYDVDSFFGCVYFYQFAEPFMLPIELLIMNSEINETYYNKIKTDVFEDVYGQPVNIKTLPHARIGTAKTKINARYLHCSQKHR